MEQFEIEVKDSIVSKEKVYSFLLDGQSVTIYLLTIEVTPSLTKSVYTIEQTKSLSHKDVTYEQPEVKVLDSRIPNIEQIRVDMLNDCVQFLEGIKQKNDPEIPHIKRREMVGVPLAGKSSLLDQMLALNPLAIGLSNEYWDRVLSGIYKGTSEEIFVPETFLKNDIDWEKFDKNIFKIIYSLKYENIINDNLKILDDKIIKKNYFKENFIENDLKYDDLEYYDKNISHKLNRQRFIDPGQIVECLQDKVSLERLKPPKLIKSQTGNRRAQFILSEFRSNVTRQMAMNIVFEPFHLSGFTPIFIGGTIEIIARICSQMQIDLNNASLEIQTLVLKINELLTDILGAADEIIYPEITLDEQNERYKSQNKADQERRVVSKALSPYIESTINFLRTAGLYKFNSTTNSLDIQIDNSKVLTADDWGNLVEKLKEENGNEWIFVVAQMHPSKLSEMLEVPDIMEDFKYSLELQLAAYRKLFGKFDLTQVCKDINENESALLNAEGNVLTIINKYFKDRSDFIISYLLYRKRYRLEIETLIKLQELVQYMDEKRIREILKYYHFGNRSDSLKEF